MIFYSFIWIYIFPIFIISPMISISLNSWFSIWISIEMNLMSFIPLIIFINKFYKEMIMKYFIIQSISSMLIILSSNMMIMLNNLIFIKIMIFIMNISLMIKLGIPPFHYWFITMMNNLNWMNCFFLSTWQKITPMILLMYNYLNWLLFMSILMSSMTSIFGINHQSIRIIMSYSSINHMSWMMLNLLTSENLWILYFLSYLIINLSIMMILNKFNFFYLNQIFNLKYNNMKLMLIMNFFSISSLPPMFGFMMKWYSIFININNNMNLIILFMMMMSLITFYFYMKISINLLLNYKINNKMNFIMYKLYNNKLNYNKIIILMFSMNIWMINIWII